LLKQGVKLGRLTSSLYIHTKSMTVLVGYTQPDVYTKLLIFTLSWSFGLHLD